MRFFADRTTTLLQIFHVIVDGLYDSVPILLSFMIVAFGAQEKDAGVILSVAALLGTLAGLGTKGCSQRFGFLRTLCLITGAYGVGYAANTFSQNIWFSGFFFVIAMMGYGVFHNAAFSYLTVRTERSMLGKVLGDFTAIGDIGRIPITAFAGFLAAWSFAGIPRLADRLCPVRGCCLLHYVVLVVDMAAERRRWRFALRGAQEAAIPAAAPFASAGSPYGVHGRRQYSGRLQRRSDFRFPAFPAVRQGDGSQGHRQFRLGLHRGCFAGKMACGRLVGIFGSRKVFITSKLLMSALLAVLGDGAGLARDHRHLHPARHRHQRDRSPSCRHCLWSR